MIRIDDIWLSREPLDMRSRPYTTLARVVRSFGEAKPHCTYVFANKRVNRLKVMVHDDYGIWLVARRLHNGTFVRHALREGGATPLQLSQLKALVIGLPRQYARSDHTIKHL